MHIHVPVEVGAYIVNHAGELRLISGFRATHKDGLLSIVLLVKNAGLDNQGDFVVDERSEHVYTGSFAYVTATRRCANTFFMQEEQNEKQSN